jgi:hypothetical protein
LHKANDTIGGTNMYDNYAQLFNDIDRICENQITNHSFAILCLFRNDISYYKAIYQKAYKINSNNKLTDREKIKKMIDLLLNLYHTNKNLMGAFKNVISRCLNISQQEWGEYYSTLNEHAKVAFDFQVNCGQILYFNTASLSDSLKICDPIETRIQNSKRRISSNHK